MTKRRNRSGNPDDRCIDSDCWRDALPGHSHCRRHLNKFAHDAYELEVRSGKAKAQ